MASIDPIHLLRKLEPAVRPPAAPAGAAGSGVPIERGSFEELMTLVSTGAVASGRPVTVGGAAALAEPLEPAQMRRLGAAADLAEARGAQRAVMLIDGRGLIIDVPGRAVTAEAGGPRSGAVFEVDAAVFVAGDEEDAAAGGPPPAPGNGLIPPAIARYLGAAGRPDHVSIKKPGRGADARG